MVKTTGWMASVLEGSVVLVSMTLVWVVLIWAVLIVGLTIAPRPSLAADICRTIDQRTVCIVTIKRSAKNFWEYNAAVSINGKRGPKEPYDCRSKIKTNPDGSISRFGKNSIGSLVCRAYRPPMHGMAMPLQIRVSETVGAWLAVPQTQRGGFESLDDLSRRRIACFLQ